MKTDMFPDMIQLPVADPWLVQNVKTPICGKKSGCDTHKPTCNSFCFREHGHETDSANVLRDLNINMDEVECGKM